MFLIFTDLLLHLSLAMYASVRQGPYFHIGLSVRMRFVVVITILASLVQCRQRKLLHSSWLLKDSAFLLVITRGLGELGRQGPVDKSYCRVPHSALVSLPRLVSSLYAKENTLFWIQCRIYGGARAPTFRAPTLGVQKIGGIRCLSVRPSMVNM